MFDVATGFLEFPVGDNGDLEFPVNGQWGFLEFPVGDNGVLEFPVNNDRIFYVDAMLQH